MSRRNWWLNSIPFTGKTNSIIFVLFNYEQADINRIKRFASDGVCTYVRFQEEICPETGRPHLQGWLQNTASSRNFKTWKNIFRNNEVHINKRKGNVEENEIYCTKEESRKPGTESFCDGVLPEQGARNDLRQITALAADVSVPWREVANSDPDTFIKYPTGIRQLRIANLANRDSPTRCFWFYGATGSGKSRLSHELTDRVAYWKTGNTKWFDGYDPCEHPDVVIDDFRASMCEFSFLLRICDRYPVVVENKGSYYPFCGERIFFTSPKPPKASWSSVSDENLDQFERRLVGVAHFLRHAGELYIRVVKGENEPEFRDLPDWLKSFGDLDPQTQEQVLEAENASIGLGSRVREFEPETPGFFERRVRARGEAIQDPGERLSGDVSPEEVEDFGGEERSPE